MNVCIVTIARYHCTNFMLSVRKEVCLLAGLCPNGGTALTNAATNLPMTCTTTSASSCPPNNVCQPRMINGVSSTVGTCCSGTPSTHKLRTLHTSIVPYQISDPCGAGYTTVLLSGSAASCNPNSANVCPGGSVCRSPSGQSNNYFCCSPELVTAITDGSSQYSFTRRTIHTYNFAQLQAPRLIILESVPIPDQSPLTYNSANLLSSMKNARCTFELCLFSRDILLPAEYHTTAGQWKSGFAL